MVEPARPVDTPDDSPGDPGDDAPVVTAASAASPQGVHTSGGILSVLSQFAGMQVVLAASGIVRNKIVAYRLGPAGFGEIVQITAFAETVGTLVVFGMAVAIRRSAARASGLEERRLQLSAANAVVLTLSGIACAVGIVLLTTGHLLPMIGLVSTSAAVAACAIFIAAVPMNALKVNYHASLEGILDVKGLAMRPVGVLLATAAAIPVVWFFGFVGAAVQFFLLSAFVVALFAARLRKLGYAPLGVSFDRSLMLHLASFGLVSVIAGFVQSLANTAVRASLIRSAGPLANGLLQAPYVLAQTLQNVILASIVSISIATVARQKEPGAMAAAADRLLTVVVPVATAALGLLGLLGSHALTILYSSEFAAGATLFPVILAADLAMVYGRVVAVPMLAHADRVLWLSNELVFAFVRWALALLLLDQLGALAVVISYLAAIVLHAVVSSAVFRLRYGMRLQPVQLARLAFGVTFVAALSVVGSRDVPPWLFACAALAWATYSTIYLRRFLLPELRRRFGRGTRQG